MIKKIKNITLLTLLFASFAAPCFAVAPPTISSSSVIGPVANPDRNLSRDGGSSIKLGNQELWMFGDTLFNPASVDGVQLRTNTAALASFGEPYVLNEPLDANQAPYQFIPFNSTEQSYNDAASDKARDRYIIWPNIAINTSSTTGLIFYSRIKSTPSGGGGYTWSDERIGAAEVTAGSTTATNRVDDIFQAPDPMYKPILLKDGIVYFTSCTADFLEYNCSLAQVQLADVLDRNSYKFWTGSAWSSDINSAAFQFRNLNGTVAWNPYLNQYVNIYHIGFGHTLRMKTASSLTGPWSDVVEFYDNTNQLSTMYVHPELFLNNGKTMIITYNDQAQSGGGVKAFQVTFADLPGSETPVIPKAPSTGGAPRSYVAIGLMAGAILAALSSYLFVHLRRSRQS